MCNLCFVKILVRIFEVYWVLLNSCKHPTRSNTLVKVNKICRVLSSIAYYFHEGRAVNIFFLYWTWFVTCALFMSDIPFSVGHVIYIVAALVNVRTPIPKVFHSFRLHTVSIWYVLICRGWSGTQQH